MLKKIKFLIIPALFLSLPFFAHAACNTATTIKFIARDANGSLIPNVRVDVYKQELDANGSPKPTTKFVSGTTDANLGVANLSFKNSLDSDTYILKVQSINKDSASYWYFGNSLSCGQSTTIEQTLSGIDVTLHGADGSLLLNTNVNIYSQATDSNGNNLKQSKELIATANSGNSGEIRVYVPQGSVRGLNKTPNDYYMLELVRPSAKFNYYNIAVYDKTLTSLDYYVSSLHVRLQDISAAPFPSGTQVEVYKEVVDSNDNNSKGTRVGTFNIGDDGWGTFEAPAAVYVLAVKGKTGQYQNFWNVQAIDGRSTEYKLTPDSSWTPSDGTCPNSANLYVNIKTYSNSSAAGLKFELYEQNTDGNGVPTPGTRVGGGTFDSSGHYTMNFKPDPRKIYALKVWDKNANLGEFWFFSATRFVCGYDRTITESLPVLKVILRDSSGALKKNFNFSLFMQDFDADNNPTIEDSNLIANLKTDNSGIARVFVSPYNPYRFQTGIYAIRSKDANNNNSDSYNIHMYPEKDTSFQYTFAGLNGELRDAGKNLLANREVRFYEQTGSGSDRALGSLLIKTKTDKSGRFRFEYPGGTYALAVLDDFNHENVFWNISLKYGKSNTVKLVTSQNRISVNASGGTPAGAQVKIFNLSTDGGHKYYKDGELGSVKVTGSKTSYVSLVPGYYLASYFDKSGKEYGRYFKSANGSISTTKITTSLVNRISENKIFTIK